MKSPSPKQEQADRAQEQLNAVVQALRDTKKILARDWAGLSPRERSAYARQVKELEEQQRNLSKELELLHIEMNA